MHDVAIRLIGSEDSIKEAVKKLENMGFTILTDSGYVNSRHEKKKKPEERKKKRYLTVEYK